VLKLRQGRGGLSWGRSMYPRPRTSDCPQTEAEVLAWHREPHLQTAYLSPGRHSGLVVGQLPAGKKFQSPVIATCAPGASARAAQRRRTARRSSFSPSREYADCDPRRREASARIHAHERFRGGRLPLVAARVAGRPLLLFPRTTRRAARPRRASFATSTRASDNRAQSSSESVPTTRPHTCASKRRPSAVAVDGTDIGTGSSDARRIRRGMSAECPCVNPKGSEKCG
jgi:hypothetical protein